MDKMDVDYAPTIFPKRPAAAKASTSQKGGAKGEILNINMYSVKKKKKKKKKKMVYNNLRKQ